MTRAGGIDWIERWRSMCDEVERSSGPSPRSSDRWRDRAARFDRMGRARPADGVVEALDATLRADDVVLDIGAGVGRHVVPIARRCMRVVAVEPSDAMRALLERRVEEERLSNVTILGAEWPITTDPPVADVALSCHVVYGVPDLPAFVEAMTRSSRRACALVLGLRAPADALGALAVRLHGAARPARPAALEALAVLHQLGIAASLSILAGTERTLAFGLGDDDVVELCHRMGVPPDEAGLARVRDVLRGFPEDERGDHVVGRAEPNALITWSGARQAIPSRDA